jgi:hypothetical protein
MSRLVSYHTDLLVSCFHVHTINKRWILRKSFNNNQAFVSSKLDTQEEFTLNNTSPRLDLNCRQVFHFQLFLFLIYGHLTGWS